MSNRIQKSELTLIASVTFTQVVLIAPTAYLHQVVLIASIAYLHQVVLIASIAYLH
jgi:hypothetical protein